jgi:hypothetical protein
MTRAIIAMIGLLALAGCAGEVPSTEQPTMYLNMADGDARLDPVAAASMISLYRQNNGVGPVTVDPELMKLAEAQSQAMASRNKLDHDVKAPLAKRLNTADIPPPWRWRMCRPGTTPWPRLFRAGGTRPRTGKTC